LASGLLPGLPAGLLERLPQQFGAGRPQAHSRSMITASSSPNWRIADSRTRLSCY
jgi:hypothetical protein